MTRKFIKAREYIIIFALAIAMIVAGSFVDSPFSQAVYSYENTSYFGIIMSGLAEIPTYMFVAIAGTLLIFAAKEISTVKKVFSWIIGIGCIAGGTYEAFDTFENIATFKRTESHLILIDIIGVVFVLAIYGFSLFLIIKKCRNKDRDLMRRVAISIIVIFAVEIILATMFKCLIGRPRPRYLLKDGSVWDTDSYRNWWEWTPFANLKNHARTGLDKDNWQSCPSGHTCTAAVTCFIIPLMLLLDDDVKNSAKARLIAFYVGAVWTLLTALSRIYAGAHFLSDVGFGMLLGSISGLLTQVTLPLIVKETSLVAEQ